MFSWNGNRYRNRSAWFRIEKPGTQTTTKKIKLNPGKLFYQFGLQPMCRCLICSSCQLIIEDIYNRTRVSFITYPPAWLICSSWECGGNFWEEILSLLSSRCHFGFSFQLRLGNGTKPCVPPPHTHTLPCDFKQIYFSK